MTGKLYPDVDTALADVTRDGMALMCGGFGLSGNPETLIDGLARLGARGLTVIANNCGAEGFGLWALLRNGQIRRLVASYPGDNRLVETMHRAGSLELELCPQGTLAERIRAGGAGIPAFYTPVGVGTVVAEGKPTAIFEGRAYLRETWLRADLAIVKAWKADTDGNLVFRKTARNFNPVMATAGRITIAEAEHIVEAGALDPDCVHTPGLYVDRVIRTVIDQRAIEHRTVRPRPAPVAA